VFGHKVLKKVLFHRSEELRERWRKLHNAEFHNYVLYQMIRLRNRTYEYVTMFM
jgi:hypothetical protein